MFFDNLVTILLKINEVHSLKLTKYLNYSKCTQMAYH